MKSMAYTLFEEPFDHVLVHHLVLVHLAHFWSYNILRIALYCDKGVIARRSEHGKRAYLSLGASALPQ